MPNAHLRDTNMLGLLYYSLQQRRQCTAKAIAFTAVAPPLCTIVAAFKEWKTVTNEESAELLLLLRIMACVALVLALAVLSITISLTRLASSMTPRRGISLPDGLKELPPDKRKASATYQYYGYCLGSGSSGESGRKKLTPS